MADLGMSEYDLFYEVELLTPSSITKEDKRILISGTFFNRTSTSENVLLSCMAPLTSLALQSQMYGLLPLYPIVTFRYTKGRELPQPLPTSLT